MDYLHPILWRKERGAPKKLPTSCFVHTESKLNPSLITRSPNCRKNCK